MADNAKKNYPQNHQAGQPEAELVEPIAPVYGMPLMPEDAQELEPVMNTVYDMPAQVPRSWTVGKGSGCDVVVNGPFVEDTHCEIIQYGSEYVIADLDSPRGTRVNGRLVESTSALKPGDVIQIGRTRLTFVEDLLDKQ